MFKYNKLLIVAVYTAILFSNNVFAQVNWDENRSIHLYHDIFYPFGADPSKSSGYKLTYRIILNYSDIFSDELTEQEKKILIDSSFVSESSAFIKSNFLDLEFSRIYKSKYLQSELLTTARHLSKNDLTIDWRPLVSVPSHFSKVPYWSLNGYKIVEILEARKAMFSKKYENGYLLEHITFELTFKLENPSDDVKIVTTQVHFGDMCRCIGEDGYDVFDLLTGEKIESQ